MKSVRTIETLIKEDFKMMKAQIIYYKEDGNHFYGFYFNRHFTACGFRFEEDIREFLLTSGYEAEPSIREVDFNNHMQQAREWNKQIIFNCGANAPLLLFND